MSDKARLAWRCRRGTKELDMLLRGFLDSQYSLLQPAEQTTFAKLLELQDPVLLEWFWGRAEPPEDLAAMIARIREYATSTIGDRA